MAILKALVSTLLFIIFIEAITVWVFLTQYFDIWWLVDNYMLIINGFVEVLIVCIFIAKTEGASSLLPKKTDSRFYIWAVSMGIGFIFFQTVLNYFYNVAFGTEYHILFVFEPLQLLKLNSIAHILLLPLAEELFYRQYLQKRLQRNHNALISVVVTAILFSILHLRLGSALVYPSISLDWHLTYITLFGGLISGFLYFKSGSYGPSFVFHAFWNLMVVIL